jgi:hypothetical protein
MRSGGSSFEDAMTEAIRSVLPEDRVVGSTPLATVTNTCLIVRNEDKKSKTIIPLARLSKIRTKKTSYPGLLVIALALFLLAAAALSSKQEDGAAIPLAVVGVLFLIGYLANRRISVEFVAGSGKTSTPDGNSADVEALLRALQSAQSTSETVECNHDSE